MAGSYGREPQAPSDSVVYKDTSSDYSEPQSHAEELRALYPQCTVCEAPASNGYTLLSVQLHKDLDLKLEFRVPVADSTVISSVSVLSRSVGKKDVRRLQRSVELHVSTTKSRHVLKELLNIVYDFIKVEGLCEVNKPLCTKREKKNINSSNCNSEKKVNCLEEYNTDNAPITKSKGKKSKRRSKNMAVDEDDEEDSNEDLTLMTQYASPFHEENWEVAGISLDLPVRPTHFIAVRVTCKTIVDQLVSVQRELVSQEPLLAKGVFAAEIFHLTLFTLGLDSQDDIENCVHALKTITDELRKCRPLNPITVYGISQFYNRAVFSKVKFQQDFEEFREYLKKQLVSFNVEIRDQYEKFNPHVTIIKVKRPERKLFGPRNIQPALYSHYRDVVFGEQKVSEIHLCPMDGQRRDDGFYTSLFEINVER